MDQFHLWVIPWLDHGMTQWVLPVHATMPCERLKALLYSLFMSFPNFISSISFKIRGVNSL
ncbi:hypothetical protein [Rickettsia endosymbiont of Ixodes pacificus]|uniref:hypothetical protein n=1 Tax=Rickettsia endosymbiont of Ixodes pacificus TaxID=1133329 RepID=UPI0012E08F3D|nr:hypothetical protein [Rickettsia endosymbiont of Ixodes pacificus]